MWPPLVAVAIIGLFAAQILGGYGLLGPRPGRPAFRRVHLGVAVAIGVALVAHDLIPLLWLKRPELMFRAWLVLPAGLLLLALFVAVVLVGLRVIPVPRPRFRRVHVTLAWVLVTAGLLHGLGIVAGLGYPMTGDCAACHRPPPAHPPISCAACHKHPGLGW